MQSAMPADPPIPSELVGRRLALLVTGGIAAYKLVDLTSKLVQGGCTVRVAMTRSAQRFAGAAAFRGVSGQPVLTDLFAPGGAAEPHVELGDWAQMILLAPATADVLARVVQGRGDDPVTATLLAARCPVVISPAMNDAMWANAAVQANVAELRRRGLSVLEPASGRLASGHHGPGRLPEASTLLAALASATRSAYDYAGLKVVVTAGGTREELDPVRYLSNHSSGKMGIAIAQAAAQRGARVILISAAQMPSPPAVEMVPVASAVEMLAALREHLDGARLLVMAAAVADFRPERREVDKIRRQGRSHLVLHLVPNPDLLLELAAEPRFKDVYRVGFAAETGPLEELARTKLDRKHLDAIVANDVARSDIAFGSDYNAGLLLFADGTRFDLERMPKSEMAGRLLDQVRPRLG